MNSLPIAQLLYLTLGLSMNLASLLHQRRHGRYLTPVKPWSGILMLLLYGACLGLWACPDRRGLQLGMLLFALLIGWGGVWRHLWRIDRRDYSGPGSRLAALAINGYGVLASLSALWP